MPKLSFFDLPQDVQLHAISFNHIRELPTLALASDELNKLAADNIIWKEFLKEEALPNYSSDLSYKDIFIRYPEARKLFIGIDKAGQNYLLKKIESLQNSQTVSTSLKTLLQKDYIRNRLLSGNVSLEDVVASDQHICKIIHQHGFDNHEYLRLINALYLVALQLFIKVNFCRFVLLFYTATPKRYSTKRF